ESSAATALAGMSDWDRAYLNALYATEQSGQQRAEIAADMARQIVPDPLDEVIVGARQESLSKLRQEIDKSEDAFYAAYNEVNQEPEYRVNCGDEIPTGRKIPEHVCKPQYIDTATADYAQGILVGYGTVPPWTVITAKTPAYKQHVQEVVATDPKLI